MPVTMCVSDVPLPGHDFSSCLWYFFHTGHKAAGPIHGVVGSDHDTAVQEPLLVVALVGGCLSPPPPLLGG